MTIKRKIKYSTLLAWSILLMAGILFSASTQAAPAPPEPVKAVAPVVAAADSCDDGTINAIMMQGGGWVGVTRELIPDFTAKTGLNVEIEEQPYGALKDKAILEMSTKTGAYDIVVLDTAWLAEFAEAGYVADLTPLIEQYKTPLEGYLPPQLAATNHNGKYYALPFEIDTRVLGINMDMAQKAGISAPPQTIQEFVDDAIAMTLDANGKNPKDPDFDPDNIEQYGFVPTGQAGPYIALDFAPFMWGMGGDILKENGPKDYTVVLDSPETIAALTMYTELLTKWHASPPASTTYEENQQEEVIRLGKGAMGILPSPSHAAHLNGSLGFEDTKVKGLMKYVPTPADAPNKPKTRTGIWAMFIPADSQCIDGAFQFAQWITTDKDATVKYASLGGASPWKAAWTDPAVTALYPFLPEIEEVMLVSWAEPPIPEWGQVRQIFGEMASESLTEQKSPEQAVKDAAERMKQVLTDAGYPNPDKVPEASASMTLTMAAADSCDDGTINAIMMQGGGWVGVTRELIPDFSAPTGLNVEIEEQPYGALKDKAILEMSTKTGAYDIVVLDTAWLAEFAEAGYVADLTPLIEQYKTPLEGYLPPQLAATNHNGKYYALPFEIDTRVLGINMDMAQKAGISAPPQTIQEFVDDAIAMTLDANGKNPKDPDFDPDNIEQYGFVPTGQAGPYIALDFAPFMWGMGGDILKENGPKDYTVVLDSPETIAALTMYTELLTKWHASPPASTTYEENQQEEVIRLGKGAMGILPSPSHAAHLDGSLGFEDTKVKGLMKYVPTPADAPNKPKTRTGIWAMFIPADSQCIDGAFQFAQWITTDKDATVKYASLGGASPWKAAWTDPAVTALYPFLPEIEEVMLVSWAEPPIPEWGQVRQIFGEMASESLTEQKSPEQAVKDAAERMKQVLTDAGYPNP